MLEKVLGFFLTLLLNLMGFHFCPQPQVKLVFLFIFAAVSTIGTKKMSFHICEERE